MAVRQVTIERLGKLKLILMNMSFGGYMVAYDEDVYSFLSYEFKLIERPIQKGIPLIGICLGCQMLAKVLGAKVYKGEGGKEIGWMEVLL